MTKKIKWVLLLIAVIIAFVTWLAAGFFSSPQGLTLSCTWNPFGNLVSVANATPPLPPNAMRSSLCFSRPPALNKSITLTYKFAPVFAGNSYNTTHDTVKFVIPESFILEKGSLSTDVSVNYTSENEQSVSIVVRPTRVGYYRVSARLSNAYGGVEYVEVDNDYGKIGSMPPNKWYDGAKIINVPPVYPAWTSYIEDDKGRGTKVTKIEEEFQPLSHLESSETIEMGKEFEVYFSVPLPRFATNTANVSMAIEFPPSGFKVLTYEAPPAGRVELSPKDLPSRISWDSFGATSTINGQITLKVKFQVIDYGFGNITGIYSEQVSNRENGVRTGRFGEGDKQVIFLYLDKFGKSFVKKNPESACQEKQLHYGHGIEAC